MTFAERSPILVLALFALLLVAVAPTSVPAQRGSKATRAATKKTKATAKTEKRKAVKGRTLRASSSRRTTARTGRSGVRGKSVARESRHSRRMSRRERLLAARREAERRRREEAARRAELARLAAIARQRAMDQALRDEAAANIARDETTGEDLEVRRAALDALGDRAGTVVVMDPKTGRVYTIVNQEWALRRGFKPCSTIKLVTGLAGLCENVIDPVQLVSVNASSYALDLTDALALSNNGFFQNVGGSVGFEKMIKYARELGLGERTGINHPNEYPGRVPVYKHGYAVNHMSSHGDDFEVTPIQLATLVSAIANGGKLLVPHLPRTPEETVNFKPEVRRQLNIPQEHLRRLIPGMIGAVNYGTARTAYDATQTIAGKTGTCIGQGSWLGLFASYAPAHDPKLAVVVVTRGSHERGRTAAAVAGQIYRALAHRFRTQTPPAFATAPELAPRPKVNPVNAAAVSDEEREADEAEAATMSSAEKEADQTQNKVKTVVKPVTRPTETTTRPAPQPKTQTPPAQTETPSTPQADGAMPDSRPRRVLATNP